MEFHCPQFLLSSNHLSIILISLIFFAKKIRISTDIISEILNLGMGIPPISRFVLHHFVPRIPQFFKKLLSTIPQFFKKLLTTEVPFMTARIA